MQRMRKISSCNWPFIAGLSKTFGGVFLSKIYTFAFKFLKFAHFLAHLGGGGFNPPDPRFDHWLNHSPRYHSSLTFVYFQVKPGYIIGVNTKRSWGQSLIDTLGEKHYWLCRKCAIQWYCSAATLYFFKSIILFFKKNYFLYFFHG